MRQRLCPLVTGFVFVFGIQACELFQSEAPPQERAQQSYNMGLNMAKQGDWGQAARLFGEASQLDPTRGEYFLHHGKALLKNGETGQAVMSLSKP